MSLLLQIGTWTLINFVNLLFHHLKVISFKMYDTKKENDVDFYNYILNIYIYKKAIFFYYISILFSTYYYVNLQY